MTLSIILSLKMSEEKREGLSCVVTGGLEDFHFGWLHQPFVEYLLDDGCCTVFHLHAGGHPLPLLVMIAVRELDPLHRDNRGEDKGTDPRIAGT